MRRLVRNAVLLAAAGVLVAGCAVDNLPHLKGQTAPGGVFGQTLFDGYIELAEMEAAEYDWRDAEAFTLRAQAVLDGNPPAPEEISARRLPADHVNVLTAARQRLMHAFDATAREKAPADAATAQIGFDCWMQEQEENHQPEDIAWCRNKFIDAMARVEDALRPVEATAPAPPPPPPPPPLPEPMVVYFGFDSSEIDAAAAAAIADVVRAGRAANVTSYAIVGHTDRAGSAQYNTALAERRVDAVADRMAAMGVPASRIAIGVAGESRPAVATEDGVREARNRRVTIEFRR